MGETKSREEAGKALTAAVKRGGAAEVRRVLEEFPEIKSRLDAPLPGGNFGETALLAAVHRGEREMVDVLLEAGADVNARSDWWAGSFGVLDNERSDLVPYLIERGARVDAYAAARHGMLDPLKEIVAKDPGAARMRGGDGQTPLHVAANVEVARFLVEHEAEIDALDVDHESTPAQYLVRSHPEVARYLVSRGCRTDILLVAALGDGELVRKHLEADPECVHTEVSERHFPMRHPHAGGHIYTWTLGKGKTVYHVAQEFGHADVLRHLLGQASDTLKLTLACERGDEAAARSLLEARPDLVVSLSEWERSRVASAAVENNTKAVRLMLSVGWPVDALGQHGGTALHWAAFHGNAEMVREVLKYGPPLELKDRDHHATPLGWATFGSKHGWYCKTGDYAETVEALLGAGARPPKGPDGIDATEPVREVLRRFWTLK